MQAPLTDKAMPRERTHYISHSIWTTLLVWMLFLMLKPNVLYYKMVQMLFSEKIYFHISLPRLLILRQILSSSLISRGLISNPHFLQFLLMGHGFQMFYDLAQSSLNVQFVWLSVPLKHITGTKINLASMT